MIYSPGDQVKIADIQHPWYGAIGIIRESYTAMGCDWEIELETIAPGQRVGAAESEIRRV